jgi:hypothetical protein
MELLAMTTERRILAHLTLFSAACLGGCGDGRLDVLERLPARGGSAASGAAGETSGGNAGGFPTGGFGGDGGRGTSGTSGSNGSTLPSPFLLDDFEDDSDTKSPNIPEGYWYFETDGACTSGWLAVEMTQTELGGTRAIRSRGGGCRNWGALLGLDLGYEAGMFDASSFDAIRLWARAEPGSTTEVSVSLLDPLHFDTLIQLDAEWREFVLPLDAFVFNDQEPEEPFDVDRLTHLQFFVFSPDAFDFWLDDLTFVRFE